MLPGIGLSELFGLYGKDNSLAERIAFAFGMGLAFSTLVMTVTTSGLTIGAIKLFGINQAIVAFFLASGALMTSFSVLRRRKLLLYEHPRKEDILVFLFCVAVASIFYLNYQKYPVFPEYNSVDYKVHVELSDALLRGRISSIPAGILYYGIHFQLALSYLLVSGMELVIARTTIAILVSLSPLLFFLCTRKLFRSRKVALISTSIYALSGSIWVGSVLNAGLYANFFGILISMFFLYLFAAAEESRRLSNFLSLLISLPALYMSHYTAVVILFAVFFFPFFQLLVRRATLQSFYPTIVSAAPALIAVALRPNLPSLLLNLAVSGGGKIVGSTVISSLLSSFPVLSYMALELYNDPAFVLMLLLSSISLYLVFKKGIIFATIPVIWLISLLVASPFNVSAWRFSFEALVPLTMLSSLTIASILPERDASVKKSRVRHGKGIRTFAILLLILPLIAGSWAQTVLADSLSNVMQAS